MSRRSIFGVLLLVGVLGLSAALMFKHREHEELIAQVRQNIVSSNSIAVRNLLSELTSSQTTLQQGQDEFSRLIDRVETSLVSLETAPIKGEERVACIRYLTDLLDLLKVINRRFPLEADFQAKFDQIQRTRSLWIASVDAGDPNEFAGDALSSEDDDFVSTARQHEQAKQDLKAAVAKLTLDERQLKGALQDVVILPSSSTAALVQTFAPI